MKRDTLKQLIKTVINEIQDPEVRKQRLAKVSQQTDANIKNTISQLRTKIDADKRKKKAEPILNKKPFKKPFNELVGEKPEIGQYRWNYEIEATTKLSDGTSYTRTDVSKWWPVLAKDEAEAKEKAIAPYNPKVVTINNVKMIKGKAVDQSDLNQYDKLVAGIAHDLRPKSQGGWGAD